MANNYTYVQIPAQNLPDYDFNVTLTGVRYNLHVRYNLRMDRWLLDIADAAGNLVVAGIVLLIQRSLTGQYTTLALPPGPLLAADLSGQNLQPTEASFLTDHALIYGEPNF